MNGSENAYAGAFFLALMSFGALLKLDDMTALIVGGLCAVAGAICLRQALNKSAQAAEEDHQRVEIQIQQLRNKIAENAAAGTEAMRAVNEAAQLVQENISIIRVRVAELDNLTKLAADVADIRSNMAVFDENFSALNVELEKISVALRERDESPIAAEDLKKFTETVAEDLKLLTEIADADKSNLQTVVKLVQFVGQTLKNQTYARELSNINTSLVKLIKAANDAAKPRESALNEQDLESLKKIAAKIKTK